MAVVNTLSATLTGFLTNPPTRVVPGKGGGAREYTVSESVAIAAADDDTSTFRVCRVHSSWILKSIKAFCTAVTGGTDYDVGLYDIDGGAVVDADLYADGVSFATAAPAVPPTAAANDGIELRFGDAATAIPGDVNSRVWEDIGGLTADPNKFYDLVLTANTVGTGAGTVALVVRYNAGS